MSPKVSVLLSVYNGALHLKKALLSIQDQSLQDWELVAVDDGSSDESGAILQSFAAEDPRIRVLQNQSNQGLAASLNRGILECRGEFIARQDADDISLHSRLKLQSEYMEQNPGLAICGSAVEHIDGHGHELGKVARQPASDQVIRLKMLLTNAFHHSSVMLRRAELMQWELAYRTDFRYGQDYELWSRLLQKGTGGNLSQPLVQFRLHEAQVSKVHWRTQQSNADQVSMANFQARGWDRFFKPEEIYWVRRTGFPMPGQTGKQRIMQANCLVRFFALAKRELELPDPCFNRLRKQYFSDLRHCARHFPRDPATLWALTRQALADPGGTIKDGLIYAKGLISGTNAPVKR